MIRWVAFGSRLAASLAACAALLATGCTNVQAPLNTLVIGIESEVERLDPLTIKNPQTFILSWQIFEGLLGLDDAGQIAPILAERWETKDFQTWTFHLRPNVSFHPSELFGKPGAVRPVKSADVLWSYTAYCGPTAFSSFLLIDSVKGCADYNSKKAAKVEGFRTVDDNTFEITLIKPEPFFLNRLTTAWISIFPRDAERAEVKDAWGLRLAVGTGPYRLESRTDSEIVLVRNDGYWGGTPAIGRLVYRVVKSDQLRFAEMTNGKIDLMVLPTQIFPAVFDGDGRAKPEYSNRFHLKTVSTFNSHVIGLNLDKVRDVHLRRAMSFGTDRSEIVRRLLYGYADPTQGIIPPGMHAYVPPFPRDAYDSQRARAELKESRYRGEPLELFIHDAANSEAIGQAFQAQMKTIGINIQLTKLDLNGVIGRIVKGEAPLFSMFFEFVFSAPEPLLLNHFTSGKIPVPNVWRYSSPTVDRAVEALRLIASREESVKRTAEIERTIMEDVPGIFLYRQKYVVIYSKKFGDLRVNGHGHYDLRTLKIQA